MPFAEQIRAERASEAQTTQDAKRRLEESGELYKRRKEAEAVARVTGRQS
jgi:hypothetical protein